MKVMNVTEQYLLEKKGSEYETEMEKVKELAETNHGNDAWYKIYLIRELAKVFRNKPEKILFIDASDDPKTGPNEHQANIFITKQNMIGESDYDEKISLSLRLGNKVVYQDISLNQALAGCIQMYFIFHSHLYWSRI